MPQGIFFLDSGPYNASTCQSIFVGGLCFVEVIVFAPIEICDAVVGIDGKGKLVKGMLTEAKLIAGVCSFPGIIDQVLSNLVVWVALEMAHKVRRLAPIASFRRWW
jgi:hypothetical protein